MGFSIKTSAPKQSKTPPPVVAETYEADTAADHNQRHARRRGLLSTILTNNGKSATAGVMTRDTSDGSTLG